jgi:hypothetical protein
MSRPGIVDTYFIETSHPSALNSGDGLRLLNWEMATQVDLGLCATCTHVEVIRSDRGSTFFRCGLSDVDARFSKYPALPVQQCIGWTSKRERGKPEHAAKESQD